jgi:hypothetical protein
MVDLFNKTKKKENKGISYLCEMCGDYSIIKHLEDGKRLCYKCLMKYMAKKKENKITPENIAKGLQYFLKNHPVLYDKAVAGIKKTHPEILIKAFEIINNKKTTIISINEIGEVS